MKTINYSKQLAIVTVAILGAASFSVSAVADESAFGTTSRAVSYSDLNLNSTAGAKVLYHRIRSAAEQVCGDVNSKQFGAATAAKACVDKAMLSSVRTVNSVRLTKTANAHGYAVQADLNVASLR